MTRVPSIEGWSSTTNIKIVNRLRKLIHDNPRAFNNFDMLYEKMKREKLLDDFLVLSVKDGKYIMTFKDDVKNKT